MRLALQPLLPGGASGSEGTPGRALMVPSALPVDSSPSAGATGLGLGEESSHQKMTLTSGFSVTARFTLGSRYISTIHAIFPIFEVCVENNPFCGLEFNP